MTVYKPDIRYIALTILALGLAVMPARSLLQQASERGSLPIDDLLFLLISLGIALWGAFTALSRVEFTVKSIHIRSPLGSSLFRVRSVEHRQLIDITLGGRLGKSVVLLYHPKLENGLLDLEAANSLFLPVVRNQQDLYNRLKAQVPK